MKEEDLDDLLAELRDELARTESVDEAEQESLRRLDEDIHRLLARSGEQPRAEPDVLERLEDSVEELEVEYPMVTKLIAQVLEALSKAGI